MTLAQQFEQKGLQMGILQGMQQGVQQGVQQGEATILKRLLQHRFGEISFMYTQRIDAADAETLLSWSEKVLDAKTLDDVFN